MNYIFEFFCSEMWVRPHSTCFNILKYHIQIRFEKWKGKCSLFWDGTEGGPPPVLWAPQGDRRLEALGLLMHSPSTEFGGSLEPANSRILHVWCIGNFCSNIQILRCGRTTANRVHLEIYPTDGTASRERRVGSHRHAAPVPYVYGYGDWTK